MPYIGNIVQDFSVNTAMLNSDSVTSIKIVDGTIQGADIAANLDLSDNQTIRFGDSQDALIFHSGSQLNIDNNTGNIFYDTVGTHYFRVGGGNETAITAAANGSVELYHDNVKKVETESNGVDVFNRVRCLGGTPSIHLNSDATGANTASRAMFGLATGANHFISGAGPNDVVVNTPHRFLVGHASSEIMAIFDPDGAVELYHDGTKQLETTSTGITTTGKIGIGTATPDEDLVISDVSPSIKLASTSTVGNTNIYFGDTDSATQGQIQYHNNGDFFRFFTNGSNERLRITSTGNVGIGTASPDVDLHVSGGSSVAKIESTSSANSARLIIKSANDTYTGVHFGDDADDDVGRIRYYHDDNHMHFSTGATERMRIDSSGQVGIGTTSPAENLHIRATSNVGIRLDDSSHSYGNIIYNNGQNSTDALTIAVDEGNTQTASTMRFRVDASEKARFTADGDFAVGTTSPTTKVHIVTPSINTATLTTTNCLDLGLRIFAGSASNTTGDIQNGITLGEGRAGLYAFDSGGGGANGLGVWTGSNSGVHERVRVDKDGKVAIGTTTILHSAMLNVRGTGVTCISTDANLTTNFTHLIFNNPNGNVGDIRTSGSSTQFITNSDYRLKENVVAISDGITRLKTLKPYRFNFKADTSTTLDGFLAHEAQQVVPEAITGTKDEVDSDNNPVYQGIDQSKLVPLLVAAVQEEISKREALESRVAALEAA